MDFYEQMLDSHENMLGFDEEMMKVREQMMDVHEHMMDAPCSPSYLQYPVIIHPNHSLSRNPS